MTVANLEERLTDQVLRRNWLILAAFVALSPVFWNLKFSLGILAGGLLATFNFQVLHRILKSQFRPGHKASVAGVVARYYLRLVLTGLILLGLLKFHLVGPIGLLIGLSVVVLNLTLSGLIMACQTYLKEAL